MWACFGKLGSIVGSRVLEVSGDGNQKDLDPRRAKEILPTIFTGMAPEKSGGMHGGLLSP